MEYSIEETHQASNKADSAEFNLRRKSRLRVPHTIPSFILASKVLYLVS